ncbi:sensor histidine kinase [Tropicimonas sp. TH_r6]|uniref:sensor histidine kinase n=1 Tax=Tropicimonas sp. TH_r6 TaxID=3082085 RepID=UPI0029553FFA|nr:sensor histidine kinase [Tropicimonas sp. TH_r6]MDV7143590.1 sensor histidine kinase [Tropicimonas sp. TH_r6]
MSGYLDQWRISNLPLKGWIFPLPQWSQRSKEQDKENRPLYCICLRNRSGAGGAGATHFIRFGEAAALRCFFVAEALKNLIGNALKHGGKALSLIVVRTERVGDMAHVTVDDDGRGLSPEVSKIAFSRFSQVEPSDGSGLGLAIASSVAERHGGVLIVNSSANGASLTIGLPVTEDR